jgi:hypothetical protein
MCGGRRLGAITWQHNSFMTMRTNISAGPNAKTDRDRSIFLQMAAAWLDIAEQWEPASSTREVTAD